MCKSEILQIVIEYDNAARDSPGGIGYALAYRTVPDDKNDFGRESYVVA
jgi:hypothetical protein